MKDIKKEIGKNIKAYRKLKGLTQEELAEKIGIEPPSMSNLERGKFTPSVETLQKLSDILGIKPYEFYVFDEEGDIEKRNILIKEIKEKSRIMRLLNDFHKVVKKELN